MAVIKSGQTASKYWYFAVLNDILHMSNGYNRPQMYDGNVVNNMGIRKPPAVATFDSNINGALTISGTYYFKFTYYNENRDIQSDPCTISASMTAGATASTDGIKIDIPAHSGVDSQVTHVKVYRTKNNGGIFYLDGEKAFTGSAITYDSILADSALTTVMGELNAAQSANLDVRNIMPSRPYIKAFKGYLWAWGSKVYSTGTAAVTIANKTVTITSGGVTEGMIGWWFRINNASTKYLIDDIDVTAQTLTLHTNYLGSTDTGLSYYMYEEGSQINWSYVNSDSLPEPESFPTHYFLPVVKDDGDEGTGIAICHNQLLLAKENSLHIVSGNSPTEFRVNPIKSQKGCISHKSMANDSEDNVIFAAEDGVYITDTVEARSMTDDSIGNIFTGKNSPPWSVDKSALSTCHAVYDKMHKLYLLWVQSSGASVIDKCLVFDFNKTDGVPAGWSWYNIEANVSAIIKDASGTPIVHWGDTYGFVKYFDQDTTNDGAGMSGSETRRGTATSSTNNTLTDSGATFNTTGDGLTSIYVKILSGTGSGQERRISSNTGTALTVATNWATNPDATSVYAIGYITSYWKSKWFDWNTLKDKLLRRIRAVYKVASSDYSLYAKIYENFSTTVSQTKYFDLDAEDGFYNANLAANRARHYRIELGISDTDKPVTLYEAEMQFKFRGKTEAKKDRNTA